MMKKFCQKIISLFGQKINPLTLILLVNISRMPKWAKKAIFQAFLNNHDEDT